MFGRWDRLEVLRDVLSFGEDRVNRVGKAFAGIRALALLMQQANQAGQKPLLARFAHHILAKLVLVGRHPCDLGGSHVHPGDTAGPLDEHIAPNGEADWRPVLAK